MSRLKLGVLFLLFSTGVYAQDFAPGRVIVKLKGQSNGFRAQGFAAKVQNSDAMMTQSWGRMNLHKVEGRSGQSTEELISELQNDPDVEYVEPDYYVQKQSDQPSTQGFSYTQVSSFVTGFGLTSAPVKGVEAWFEVTQTNLPVVAIIDTGIDLEHPALADAIWENTGEIAGNGIDDDGNGFVDDVNGWNFSNGNGNVQDCDGHGTHVAGIVRGTTQFIFDPDNLEAPLAKLMPVKFLDCDGNGTTSAAINAIYYAVNNGAKILNNSWGGGGYSRALHEAILYSYNARTLFIAAAGNSSNNNDTNRTYPASYDVPNVIAVAATTPSDNLASFSNYGRSMVHLGSPGSQILSTYPDFSNTCDSDNNPNTYDGCFSWLSGTSMAAPLVAGVAALMVNEKPSMSGYQLKGIITDTVDYRTSLAGRVNTNGRVNSQNAVVLAKNSTVSSYQPHYEIGVSSEDRGLASAIASGGAACGMVSKFGGSGGGGDGGTPYTGLFVLSILLMLPFLLASRLRARGPRRAHTRYAVSSRIRIAAQGAEIEADLSTISVGGAGFNTIAQLDKGSVITLKIQDPQGNDIEVKGRVVWNSATSSYGVKFEETNGSVVERIRAWTRLLLPE